MAVTPDATIAAVARAAGFPDDQIVTAVAVALAESSGRADVRNSIGASGLWQILERAHPDLFKRYDWRNPADNAAMAYSVYRDAGSNWSPWVAYTSGAYRAFLPRARKAAAGTSVAPPVVGSDVVSDGGTTFLEPTFWPRLGWGVAGVIALLIALVMVSRIDRFIPAGRVIRKVVR